MNGNPGGPDGALAGKTVPNPPQTPAPVNLQVEVANSDLINEVKAFLADCRVRYRFNNAWDVTLTIVGILLSIAVVGASFLHDISWVTALLGAVVAAVVTAQKAFPFGQRANFYRLLIGQSQNLITRAFQGVIAKSDVVNVLASLRMDFAQQLPRGSSSNPSNPSTVADPGVGVHSSPAETERESAHPATPGQDPVTAQKGQQPAVVVTPDDKPE